MEICYINAELEATSSESFWLRIWTPVFFVCLFDFLLKYDIQLRLVGAPKAAGTVLF